jgi:hypothetical protein
LLEKQSKQYQNQKCLPQEDVFNFNNFRRDRKEDFTFEGIKRTRLPAVEESLFDNLERFVVEIFVVDVDDEHVVVVVVVVVVVELFKSLIRIIF